MVFVFHLKNFVKGLYQCFIEVWTQTFKNGRVLSPSYNTYGGVQTK